MLLIGVVFVLTTRYKN